MQSAKFAITIVPYCQYRTDSRQATLIDISYGEELEGSSALALEVEKRPWQDSNPRPAA